MDKIISLVRELTRVNVEGGYFDHLCHDQSKKQYTKAGFDILYHTQRKIHALGRKRSELKNKLDQELTGLLSSRCRKKRR